MAKKYRDAGTGKYVKKATADKDPKGTVSETTKPKKKKADKQC